MAINDFSILHTGTYEGLAPMPYLVQAAATTINSGELVKKALGSNYVTVLATGDITVGTDYVAGLSTSKSTQTASADGEVYVLPLIPGTTYLATPTTPANFDTQAEYNARVGRRVTFTLTGSTYTIDDTDGATNGAVIEALDITDPATAGKVAFSLRAGASYLA